LQDGLDSERKCILFSDKCVPWFDASDICKREYSNSLPLSELNWLALRQLRQDNRLVWTGLQSNTSSELLDNGIPTSIFNPAWSDNDPTRKPDGECVAMDLASLTDKAPRVDLQVMRCPTARCLRDFCLCWR
ncbi:hypothetical protein PENTCL1PPCAC_30536, partial [Pristionchus entomophagus]